MKRGKFSLSHTKLFSGDLGELIPCGLVEVLPGDTIQHACSALVRAAPLLAPIMHPVEVRIHHWFVPHRLVWTDWENFITGGPDGMNASVFPTVLATAGTGFAVGSLADYLGLPGGAFTAGRAVSALPFRAYNLIWNEWYRDQDLETKAVIDLTDGADTTTNMLLKNCAWEKDYFTSSRPWEQKGPAISIPLGGQAQVKGLYSGSTAVSVAITGGQAVGGNVGGMTSMSAGGNMYATSKSAVGTASNVALSPTNSNVYADLSTATATNVNMLREAFALQRFEEARARYGSRYVEYLRYLGVRSSDARLSRPEYLGGGRQTIQFSEVVQTAEGTDPVGDLKGHGIGTLRSYRYRRFFEEHGYIMSLMSVRPKTIYMSGVPRTWNRRTKEDFFQKELQHIGQQEVLNKEVYFAHTTPDGIFGYQDRYDEYRRHESSVAGEFRTTSLNFWHFARDFASDPALNASFVTCVPTERTFAVPSTDVIYVMAKHSIQARRIVANMGNSFIF